VRQALGKTSTTATPININNQSKIKSKIIVVKNEPKSRTAKIEIEKNMQQQLEKQEQDQQYYVDNNNNSNINNNNEVFFQNQNEFSNHHAYNNTNNSNDLNELSTEEKYLDNIKNKDLSVHAMEIQNYYIHSIQSNNTTTIDPSENSSPFLLKAGKNMLSNVDLPDNNSIAIYNEKLMYTDETHGVNNNNSNESSFIRDIKQQSINSMNINNNNNNNNLLEFSLATKSSVEVRIPNQHDSIYTEIKFPVKDDISIETSQEFLGNNIIDEPITQKMTDTDDRPFSTQDNYAAANVAMPNVNNNNNNNNKFSTTTMVANLVHHGQQQLPHHNNINNANHHYPPANHHNSNPNILSNTNSNYPNSHSNSNHNINTISHTNTNSNSHSHSVHHTNTTTTSATTTTNQHNSINNHHSHTNNNHTVSNTNSNNNNNTNKLSAKPILMEFEFGNATVLIDRKKKDAEIVANLLSHNHHNNNINNTNSTIIQNITANIDDDEVLNFFDRTAKPVVVSKQVVALKLKRPKKLHSKRFGGATVSEEKNLASISDVENEDLHDLSVDDLKFQQEGLHDIVEEEKTKNELSVSFFLFVYLFFCLF
jgi:hypothetical protein